jgi:hypothetical protein
VLLPCTQRGSELHDPPQLYDLPQHALKCLGNPKKEEHPDAESLQNIKPLRPKKKKGIS